MVMNVELYQDTGPVVSGHGTTRMSVTNVGWKSSGLDETNSFVLYPIGRPVNTPFGFCYTQYTYAKISGTFAAASRPRITISGAVDGPAPEGYAGNVGTDNIRLFYKLTNIYTPPSGLMDGTLSYFKSGTEIIFPTTSTVGPEAATTYNRILSGSTTYYTQYLVTQLYVAQSIDTGNIGEIHIKFEVDEYESTDY